MIGYRKRSFTRAHALLTALRGNTEDLESLTSLQQLLLGETLRAEKKIRELKAELKGIQHTGGQSAVKRSSHLKNRIERVRQAAYVWRCFGDAIAFLYMDKFALKQCFYSTENANPKQGSGFISDKLGLQSEIALLEEALSHDIPALLVDLTNTIRHGDVCLMVGPDPYLIEVKSSKDLNNRGKKQKRALEKLRSFYETDKADLRGVADVRRVSFKDAERTYIAELNACIAEARKNGSAVRNPELGLYYLVAAGGSRSVVNVLRDINPKEPWVFMLNEFKVQRAWAPYMPFTLSLEAHDDLWDFIRGNLYIVVLLEADELCNIAMRYGHEAMLDPTDLDYPLRVKFPLIDEPSRISSHILSRIGMEFVSPEWIVQMSIDTIKRRIEEVKIERELMSSSP